MRSRVPTTFRQFPSLLLNGTCGSGLWPTPWGVWFPSPAPRRCWQEGRAGGRTDGQSSRLAGSRLPALCAPGRLPVPFVTSACGKQWPCGQVPPAWSPSPWVRPPTTGGRASGNPAPSCPPGQGGPAYRFRRLLTEPGHRRRHCRPRWMAPPRAPGQASWPPAPAPRGCAEPGCGGAGLRTAGPCPWSWPAEAEKCQVIRPPGQCSHCPCRDGTPPSLGQDCGGACPSLEAPTAPRPSSPGAQTARSRPALGH